MSNGRQKGRRGEVAGEQRAEVDKRLGGLFLPSGFGPLRT